MESFLWLVAFWLDGVGLGQAPPALLHTHQLARVNHRLSGKLLDFTHNHGADRRIWSPALQQHRDLYVYLPPGYEACKTYPMAIFLHGAGQDEQFFLQTQVPALDKAIMQGFLPPLIVAAPDGSLHGKATLIHPASFWANTEAGRFEDYLMVDVYGFLMRTFPIRTDRDSHALIGASMGGSAAFAQAIKHRDQFKMAIGFMPLLNLRYVDCHGRYRTSFDPECFALRTCLRPRERLGRRRFFVLRFDSLFGPLYGEGSEAVEGMSEINPLELMERLDLRDGELDLYVAYGGRDEFNVAAQVDSFLHCAAKRGIHVTVDYDPRGKHDLATGMRQLPGALRWAAQRMEAAGLIASPASTPARP